MKNIYLTLAALFAAATVNVQAQNTANGHEYVDLGLPSGTLWATVNIGAENPEDYGDYFAWGETETKTEYTWATYKWCNGSITTLTKYNNSSSDGTVDNKTVLDPEDDVAHVKWGDEWRMPTLSEVGELINNCTWRWTTQNGVYGRRVTSDINGNSIFLPAAGYRDGTSIIYEANCGTYWSSSLFTLASNRAGHLYFTSGVFNRSYFDRYYGQSVRPVINKTATGIKSINNDQLTINGVAGAVRYNLAGQRVGNDYKGIVIVNGKKRVVK